MSENAEKRRIVLGITGSIAAYKSAELARIYLSRGYEVRVIMTESAQKFISPLLMQCLTGKPVMTGMWDGDGSGISHIDLASWGDVLVVAPATADFISKLRYGMADSSLLAVALASKVPVLVAPAMNVNMYENVATQENISILRERGISFVGPDEGDLACGWTGAGRLSEPWEIFYHTRKMLSVHDFVGKKFLITTGPTREPIDPVRFISNRSSGKMGVSIVREAFCRGGEVTLIHGPCEIKVPKPTRLVPVTTAREMHDAVMREVYETATPPDIVIMTAAVGDFRPIEVSGGKIKKGEGVPSLTLTQNPDILSEVGERRGDKKAPVIVGFAVETGDLDELLLEVRSKMQRKKTDLMVGNFAQEAFELDTNRVWLIDKHGKQEEVATNFKSRVANKILNAILGL